MLPLVLLAAALTSCGGVETCERIDGVRQGVCLTAPELREPAPVVAAPRLGDGEDVSLGDFAGDVVVVNFWASWCGPCRREQPELNLAYEDLSKDGVAFIGVDLQESTEANGLAHEREFEIPYPSIYDPTSSFAARFEGVSPQTIPSTVFLDRQGRVAAQIRGETTASEIIALVRELLAEPG